MKYYVYLTKYPDYNVLMVRDEEGGIHPLNGLLYCTTAPDRGIDWCVDRSTWRRCSGWIDYSQTTDLAEVQPRCL